MEAFETLFSRLDTVSEKVSVDAVFGKPQTYGDRVVIPVAEIAYGFGAGGGIASAPGCACEGEPECECEAVAEDDGSQEWPVGGGGGAGGKARPVAYIEVTPEGTRVQPIVDEQRIALAGILLGAWAVGWVGLVLKTLFTRRA